MKRRVVEFAWRLGIVGVELRQGPLRRHMPNVTPPCLYKNRLCLYDGFSAPHTAQLHLDTLTIRYGLTRSPWSLSLLCCARSPSHRMSHT